jgi:hypothetical protein
MPEGEVPLSRTRAGQGLEFAHLAKRAWLVKAAPHSL